MAVHFVNRAEMTSRPPITLRRRGQLANNQDQPSCIIGAHFFLKGPVVEVARWVSARDWTSVRASYHPRFPSTRAHRCALDCRLFRVLANPPAGRTRRQVPQVCSPKTVFVWLRKLFREASPAVFTPGLSAQQRHSAAT